MKRIPDRLWPLLAARYPDVADDYRARLSGSASFLERQPGKAQACALLEELVAGGFLAFDDRALCPGCEKAVDEVDLAEKRHRGCGYSLEHEDPDAVRFYSRPGLRARDSLWLVTVHGMNTRGPWQEEFSWKLARIYGYAVPVAIYKYGRILISPLLLLRQESYAGRFAARLKELRSEMERAGYGDRPDVIAHSFGTWLLARVLQLDPELCLGRVVLTGSAIPPDFDWGPFLEGDSPRVEAVLCHYGGRDHVVPLAQFFVPFSGPSGRRGFNDAGKVEERLRHRFEPTFGHSAYFAAANLDRVMTKVWGPFLTLPDAELGSWGDTTSVRSEPAWRRSWLRGWTHGVKYLVLALLVVLLFLLGIALTVGVHEIVGWLD